jgi:arabinogalactan oligomer/maltooligosaccharide transport system permease protein
MLLGFVAQQVENNNFVNQDWRNRQGTLTYGDITITPEFVPSNLDVFSFREEMLFAVKQTVEKSYITATGLNYAAVLFDEDDKNDGFLTWLWNSILITMSTAFLGMTLASTAAYAFSRFTFPGKRTGLIFLLGTQMIPAAMMMLPIYLLADAMGLIGSLNGLIFAYSVGSIPFSIWILKGYYDTIPFDLEEAARIDGATQMQTFFRIILPLAAPALAIVFLFNFMAAWNDYLLARILLAGELKTWVLGLVSLQGQFSTDWGKFSAAALMVSVPVVMLFLASSKYLVSGLTLGSVKG